MFLPHQIAHLQKTAPRSPSPALPGAWPLHTTPDNDHTRDVIFERLSQSQPSEPLTPCSGLHHAFDKLPVCDTGTSTMRTDPVLIAPFPHLPHVETPPCETAYMALSASVSTEFTEFQREKLTGADIDAPEHLTYPQPTLDSELGLASKFYQTDAPHANSVLNSDSSGLLGVISELPLPKVLLTEASPPLIWPEQPNPVPSLTSMETTIQLTPSVQMLAQRTQAFLLEFPGSQDTCENSLIENRDNQRHDPGSVSPSSASIAAPHDRLLPVPSVPSTHVDLFGYPNLLSSDTGTESTREVNGGLDPDFLSLLSQPDGDEAWTLLLGSASQSLSVSSTPSPNSVSLSLSPASPPRPSDEAEQHVGFSSSLSSPDARQVEALTESVEDGETEATQYAAALLETALATVNTITRPRSSEDDALAIDVRIPDLIGHQKESRGRDKNASSHSNVVVRGVKRLGGKVKKFFSKQTKGSEDQSEGQRPGPTTAGSLVFDQDEIVDMEGTPYEDQQGGSLPLRLATIRSSVSSPVFTSTLPPRNPICTTISEDPEILSPPSVHQSSSAYQNIIPASQSLPLDGTVGSINQHSLHSYGIFSRPKTLAEIKSKRRFSLPTFPSSTSPPLGTSVVAASTPLTKPQSTMACMRNGSAPGGPSAGEDRRPRSVVEPGIPVCSRRLSQPVKKNIWQSFPRISALRKG